MERFENIRNHLIVCPPGADDTVYTRAEGIRFTDEAGRTYRNLNDISCVLGYGHPRFTRELSRLVTEKMLAHGSMMSPEKERLIQNFMNVTDHNFDKILFTGSGGEVVDWAIKAARRVTGRDRIITFRNALHGRSFAGAWISDTPLRKEGFGSGLQNITFWDCPSDGRPCQPDAGDLSDAAAVIIEPYQASGMGAPSAEYWKWLREYTKAQGVLLIFDEIQTGFGKTGHFFAYPQTGVIPDILLAGKGMSNGFGLGAMLMSGQVGSCIRPYEFSGGSADNDLMCSIVNLVFDIFADEKIPEHANRMGTFFREQLAAAAAEQAIPCSFRGDGLFFSMLLPDGMAAAVVPAMKEQGILLGRWGNMLVFRPPLILTEEDIVFTCEKLRTVLKSLG